MDPLTLLLLCALTGGACVWAGRLWRRIARSRQVVSLLYDDKPQIFLEEIEKDIAECDNGMYRTCLLVNKSAGLYYVGRFEEAVSLLQSLAPERLPRVFKSVYYHNLLAPLLDLGRYDEARRLMEEHGRMLVPETKMKALNEAIRGSLALYQMHCGDRRAGYEALSELCKHATTDPGRAFRLYHLGLADLQDGRPERAEASLLMAATLAPNSFVPREVERLVPRR